MTIQKTLSIRVVVVVNDGNIMEGTPIQPNDEEYGNIPAGSKFDIRKEG